MRISDWSSDVCSSDLTLVWMARRVHGVAGLAELVPLGVLGEDEFASLERERQALSRLRFGLHLVAGRREERLLFDLQKALAARLGLRDERADNLAVEQLMQGFFRSAATVLRSEEHTSELQSLMRISYAVFCLKKKK